MSQEMSVLARNIETRRKDLGITTSIELARKSGVSRAVLTNIKLNPTKSVMLDSALKLADTLKCRLEWLATGEGSPSADEYSEYSKIELGAPVVTLNELINNEPKEYLKKLLEEDRERLPCPAGNSKTQFVIRLTEDVGKYAAGGVLYFDIDKTPVNGQLVLVETHKDNLELMEYQTSHGRQFLKSLSDDVPPDLKFVEIENQKSIATFAAYAVF